MKKNYIIQAHSLMVRPQYVANNSMNNKIAVQNLTFEICCPTLMFQSCNPISVKHKNRVLVLNLELI